MGAVASTVRNITSVVDFLKDIHQRQEFAQKFFNDEHDLAAIAVAFLIHCKPSLWSLVLICSKQFRKFFGDAQQRSLICREDMEKMYQYLIIDPISKMQWHNKITEIVKNYPITDQGNLGICWSHAIATAIYLSQSRIVGRRVDNFLTIRQRLLDEFGYGEQNPANVMKRVLPRYGLHFHRVYPKELGSIVWNGRVCVAGFYLNGIQWYNFSKFFNDPEKKDKIITSADLNRRPSREELRGVELEAGGHAVVLTDSSQDCWTFMNSWGENWADKGIFRVQPGAIDVTFYDVFWYVSDLSQSEIQLFQSRGHEALERFYEIVAGIDDIIEENKRKIFQVANAIVYIINTCAKISKSSSSESFPGLKEVDEIVSSVDDLNGNENENSNENSVVLSTQEENNDGNNQIIVKEDNSVVINGKEITSEQINLMVSFLAGIFSMSDVTSQLEEMSNHFWR